MTWNWNKVADQLRDAFLKLPLAKADVENLDTDPTFLTGTQEEFFEFLEHNELELAWDALAEMGKRSGAGEPFWLKLTQAANGMNLLDKAAEAFEKSRVKTDSRE